MQRQRRRALSLFLAVLTLCLTALPAAAESAQSATAVTVQLMKTEGSVGVTNASGRGMTVGTTCGCTTAAFSAPQGVTVGEDGTVYVSDTVNGAVRQIKNGEVTTMTRRVVNDLRSFIPISPVGLGRPRPEP